MKLVKTIVLFLFAVFTISGCSVKQPSGAVENGCKIDINLLKHDERKTNDLSLSCNEWDSPFFLEIVNRSNDKILVVRDIYFDSLCIFPESWRLLYSLNETVDSLIPYSRSIGSFSYDDATFDTLSVNMKKKYVSGFRRISKELKTLQLTSLTVEYNFSIIVLHESGGITIKELPLILEKNILTGEINQIESLENLSSG